MSDSQTLVCDVCGKMMAWESAIERDDVGRYVCVNEDCDWQPTAIERDETQMTDYTWRGDTWWMTNCMCPTCGTTMSSNGRVRACVAPECEYWELLEGE